MVRLSDEICTLKREALNVTNDTSDTFIFAHERENHFRPINWSKKIQEYHEMDFFFKKKRERKKNYRIVHNHKLRSMKNLILMTIMTMKKRKNS